MKNRIKLAKLVRNVVQEQDFAKTVYVVSVV